MPSLRIVIRRKDDNEPAFPELNIEDTPEAHIYGSVILEHGMSSGKTSVGFVIEKQDGEKVLVQTSAAIIDALYHAIKGAEFHWQENPL